MALAPIAMAQERPAEITPLLMPVTESGEGYVRALRLRQIQHQLFYIEKLVGEIPMNGAPRYTAPETETGDPDSTSAMRVPMMLVFGTIVLVLGLVFYRLAGGGRTLFTRLPSERKKQEIRDAAAAVNWDETLPITDLLTRLRMMSDRQAALVLLIEHALRSSAQQNNLRLGRSETAREILRRIPGKWPLINDLRRLVMTEELVQFGGRELAEKTFDDCMRRATPILAGDGK